MKMPKGKYKRSIKQIEHCKTINIGRTPWNKGKNGVQYVSDETRKKLSLINLGNKKAKGSIRTKEFKENISLKLKGRKVPEEKIIKGEDHWNWKGGVSRNRHTSYKYIVWRSSIFERDNWTCQTCRIRGGYLEAHHIKSWARYPELRYDINNGVTLCRDCHSLTDNYKGKNNGIISENFSNQKDKPTQE